MYAASVYQAASCVSQMGRQAEMTHYRLEDSLVQDFKREAVRHAEQQYPKEAAGLVVNGSYFPCRNIADDPENTFVINPVDYARATLTGTIEAVVHSHPQGTPVSEHDRKACRQTKMPWYVYSVPDQQWLTIDP